MSKFGEILKGDTPVLVYFNVKTEASYARMETELKAVADYFGEALKLVEVEALPGEAIVRALRIAALPDFVLYKNEDMIWRTQGSKAAQEIINEIERFI